MSSAYHNALISVASPVAVSRFGSHTGVYANDIIHDHNTYSHSTLQTSAQTSGFAVVSLACGPLTTAAFTFVCVRAHSTLNSREHADDARFVMGHPADQRIRSTLSYLEAHLVGYQRGGGAAAASAKPRMERDARGNGSYMADSIAVVHPGTQVPYADTIAFATLEEGVGDVLDDAYFALHYIAPYFLDKRRVVVQGEFFLLPFCNGDHDALRTTERQGPRLFWVSSLTARGAGGVFDDGIREWAVMAEITDETTVEVVGACKGPIVTRVLRYAPREEVALTLPSSEDPAHSLPPPANERSPTPRVPEHVSRPLTPLPPLSDGTPAAATSPPALFTSLDEAAAIRNADARTQRTLEAQALVRSFYELEARWQQEMLFDLSVGKLYRQHCSGTERDIENWTLQHVQSQYRLAARLCDRHKDIITYLEALHAHPSRGNILRFEQMSSIRANSAAWPGGLFATAGDAIQRSCREDLGVVATSVFATSDERVVYVTVALSCMATLEDHFQRAPDASRLLLDVAMDDTHEAFASGEGNPSRHPTWSPSARTWAATMLTTTIIEDLCRRREQTRAELLLKTRETQQMAALKEPILLRAKSLRSMYERLCEVSEIPPLHTSTLSQTLPTPTLGPHHVDDGSWWSPTVSGLHKRVEQVEQLLQMLTTHTGADCVQVEPALESLPFSTNNVTLRDVLSTPDGRDAEVFRCPDVEVGSTSTGEQIQLLSSRALLALDDAYRPLRTILSELATRTSTLATIRSRLSSESAAQHRRRAVADQMHQRLVPYMSTLKPYLETFLPVVLPTLIVTTDHRASTELLQFLTASSRAQQSQSEVPWVEAEVAAFYNLVKAMPQAMPRIPPFQLDK